MEFAEWIAAYPDDVQKLAREARRLIRELVPDAVEQVDLPAKMAAYSVGSKMSDVICTISPLKSAVNIGIFRAVDLQAALRDTAPESVALLEGTGKLHRHVKIRRPEDLQSPALRTLLEAAIAAKRPI